MANKLGFYTFRGRIVDGEGTPVDGALVRLVGGAATLGADPRAVANSRGSVSWTQKISGRAGSRWNCWQKFVGPNVEGITWEEFRAEAEEYNPSLRETDGQLEAARTYYLPENRTFADTPGIAPAVIWDRALSDFDGSLWSCWKQYVRGKVAGLSWEQFRREALNHNPSLAGDDKRLHAGTEYFLPRNLGLEEYTRTGYSLGLGRFAFEGLLPGTYRLEVSAAGFKPLEIPLDLTGDQEMVLRLEPLALFAEPVVFAGPAPAFVRAHGRDFAIGGRSFKFIGVNLRALAHYGTPQMPYANAKDQLKAAKDIGARVVRIFLPHRDISPDAARDRLAGLIGTMKQECPEMYLIVALTNLYGDVGFDVPGDWGFGPDNMGFYSLRPGNQGPAILGLEWFRDGYRQHYLPFVKKIVEAFRDEPMVMAWNIGNELKAEGAPELLIQLVHAMARSIRQWDTNHLITTGMISTRHAYMAGNNALRRRLYGIPELDFITNHSYHIDGNDKPSPEDDSDLARELSKPLVIEEAGFAARDDRTRLYAEELDLLFGRGASGYMPWGFMAGGDTGDGDDALGVDHVWHGADWDSLRQLFRTRASALAAQSVDIPPASGGFKVGQQVFAEAGARLRRPAGLQGNIVITFPQRTAVTVTGPDVSRDNLRWWPVRATLAGGRTEDGWIAQTAPNGTVLLSAV